MIAWQVLGLYAYPGRGRQAANYEWRPQHKSWNVVPHDDDAGSVHRIAERVPHDRPHGTTR